MPPTPMTERGEHWRPTEPVMLLRSMPRRPKRVETAALSVCRESYQNHYYAQMRANTYALNGVAALDRTGVALARRLSCRRNRSLSDSRGRWGTPGRGDRKKRESEEGSVLREAHSCRLRDKFKKRWAVENPVAE